MGSGKGNTKTPKPPDYEALIGKQATVNRVDQISPFGTIAYSGPDKSTQTITLSPQMQGILDSAIGRAMQGGSVDAPAFDQSFDRKAMEDAIFNRSMSLVEPQFQQRERQLLQNLADRGLVEGSEAYNRAYSMEMDAQNRARQDAALSAVLGGNDAWNAERGYALNRDQVVGQRDQIDFNQLAALLGATPQSPVTPVDVSGAAGLNLQGQMAAFNAQNAKNQNKKGLLSDVIGGGATLGGMLATGGMLSDARLKTNIRFVEHRNGHNWYAWDWKDGSGSSFGVLAQEVQTYRPEAVADIGGVLHVNYGAL